MSAKGRPEREHRSAQHEGSPVSAKGRPKGEHRSARGGGRAIAVVALLALHALSTGCGMGREPTSRTLTLTECRLPRLSVAAQCGELPVPENRDRPEGRRIGIFVAVLPANTVAPKADPLIILAGGPGQAASRLAPLASRLNEVRRTRDVVLIDQRGTGRSAPLDCAAFQPEDDLEAAFDRDPVGKARECLRELAATGVDLAQYTTEAWVADIDAVRAALGYPQVNLWGGSYGTRVALAYLRRHPDRVRSMVLDGVAPPEMAVPRDVWHSREQALDDVLGACAASDACRRQHPDLRQRLDRLERDFAAPGRRIEYADPRSGGPRTGTFTFDLVLGGLHALTYAPERAALLPEVIDRAAAGDFGPLLALAQAAIGDLSGQMTPALHYAVICSEDAPRVTPEERRGLERLRSRALAASLFDVCAIWPKGTPAADAATPVRSDVPALLLSGGLDPVTPPAAAAIVAATLPRSRQVVAQGSGHIVSPYACVPRLIAAFVDDADAAALPASCIDFLAVTRRSPLWPDRLGPQP
ncbi:MAG: alpha/beta fold hydrolase [Betaproteobacteria bacterium]|nr:alpha/beta fold hydrolase [Betaproteobacteria bacterium]